MLIKKMETNGRAKHDFSISFCCLLTRDWPETMNPYISLYATTTLAQEELKDYYNFYVVLFPLSLCILCMIYGRIFYVFGLWKHPPESLSTSLFCNTINMHFFNYRISHRVSIRERMTRRNIMFVNLLIAMMRRVGEG